MLPGSSRTLRTTFGAKSAIWVDRAVGFWRVNRPMEQRRDFTFAGRRLWISGVSEEVGQAIRAAVLSFKHRHRFARFWQVRVYGLPDGVRTDIWIRRRGERLYGCPFTIFNSADVGAKVFSLLEEVSDLPLRRPLASASGKPDILSSIALPQQSRV